MNQFIATATAEKLTALKTYDYLEEKASQGSAAHLSALLKRVLDRNPEEYDR